MNFGAKINKTFFLFLTTLPLLSQANTFYCTGRMGPFEMTLSESTLKISGVDGNNCTLNEDKTFNSDERSFFQVLGAYDNDGRA
ncbi:MAG: hypothetical protein R3A80_03165 [Bdellovibrionota bacterium]